MGARAQDLRPVVARRYEIVAKIGEGGLSEAWLGRDLGASGRRVVVKICATPGDAEAIVSEYAVLSALAHPNLVPVCDQGVAADGRPFLVEPFVSGEDLGSWAAGAGLEPLAEAVAALCRGLGYVHGQGLVHGDLSPKNVVVPEAGPRALRLIDFGLAGSVRGGPALGLTPRYAAPELLLGAPPTVRSDLYALGAVLFEIATGEAPRPLDAPRGPVRLGRLAPLSHLVSSLLCRAPEGRPESAAAVTSLLEEATGSSLALTPAERAGDHFSPARLVGRDDVLSRILASVERVGEVRGVEILLAHGEAGSGLTRLAAEAARRARLRGFRVAEVGSAELGGAEPLTEVVRRLGVRVREADSAAGAASRLGEALLAAAASSPLLVAVDRLEPGHALSVDALRLASAGLPRPPGVRLVVLATARSADLSTSPRLGGLAEDATTVEIGPLSDDALGRLVAAHVEGQWPDPGFLAALRERTFGLPGKVAETLRYILASGALPPRGGASWPALGPGPSRPERSGRTAVGHPSKVDGLSRRSRRALAALALCRASATLDEWRAALGSEGDLDESAVEGLVRAGLVLRRDAEESTRFAAADRARAEASAEALSQAEVAAAHLRALEALGHGAALETRAHHLHGAGRRGEAEALLVDAARRALAERDPGRAAALLDVLPAGLGERSAEARLLRARSLRATGRLEEALAEVDGAGEGDGGEADLAAALLLDLGRPADALARLEPGRSGEPQRKEARLRRGLLRAEALLRLGEAEAGERALDGVEGLAVVAEAGLRARLSHLRGLVAYGAGRYDEAREHLARARALLESAGEAGLELARVVNSEGMVASQAGDLEAAAAAYARCLDLAVALREPLLEATYCMNLATVAQLRGEADAAIDGYRRSVALARALGAARLEARSRANLGLLLCELGAAGAALKQLEPARRLASDHGFKDILAQLHVGAAEAHLALERWGEAEAAIDEADAVASEPAPRLEVLLVRCRHALATRRWDELASLSTEALELGGRHGLGPGRALAALFRGLAAAEGATRRPAEARGALDDAVAESTELGLTGVAWQAHLALSRLALLEGDAEASRDHGARAKELFDEELARVPPGYREPFLAVRHRREARLLLGRESSPRGSAEPAATPRRYRHLLEVIREVSSERQLQRLLERIVDRAVGLAGAERGFVLLVEGGRIDAIVAQGMDAEPLGGGETPFSRSVAEDVVRTGEPVLTVDAIEDSRFGEARSVRRMQLRSILCVPLRAKGEVLGALYLDNHLRRDAFDGADAELVMAFASQVALAVVNARLHEEGERRRREVEERSRATERENEELAREVDRTSAELEAASERLRRQSAEMVERYRARSIIGSSPAMQAVFQLLDRVAESDVPVFVFGESGTGKELVARAIHAGGPRRDRAFVAVNCAAIPPLLLESELFGHVRGAFTGAVRDKAGLFELAHGGTLFLDEIGDMDLHLQGKLLRALQEGTFRRVGQETERRSDVRIVSASHRDLAAEVRVRSSWGGRREAEPGAFREDLFYRLNVVQVDLPPLRSRREDIPLLVEHFLRKHGPEGQEVSIAPEALALLLDYPWPGNVRELENQVQRALVLGGPEVTSAALGPRLREGRGRLAAAGPLKEAVVELERELIARALEETAGNVAQAARTLGLNRVVLYRKLERYGLRGAGGLRAAPPR